MRKPFFSLTLLASLSLLSCSTILNHLPWVYTVAVQQGNIVTQTMVDQLQPNMTKKQVLFIMGSPMLVDAFHPKRWDYIYSNKPSSGDYEQKRISLFFNDDDRVMGIQGDFKPSDKPIKPLTDVTVNVPKRDLDKTMWEKITGLVNYDGSVDDSPKKPLKDDK
jgi:outer membrane protein assembly factor BamE